MRARSLFVPAAFLALSGACRSAVTPAPAGADPAICARLGRQIASCSPDCAFADPAAAAAQIRDFCQMRVSSVPEEDGAALLACFDCLASAGGPSCVLPFSIDSAPQCSAPCGSLVTAEKGFGAGANGAESEPTCTNGRKPLMVEDCRRSGQKGECSLECCNGPCGDLPEVAARCTEAVGGALTCSCTVGKNVSRSFQSSSCGALAGEPLWTICNL